MKDWKGIAKARDLDIPLDQVDRIAEPLNALEASFRPLVKGLSVDIEPAIVYRPEDGE
jgi:hypothetical protein